MTPGELKFALEVETALNTIPQVSFKQQKYLTIACKLFKIFISNSIQIWKLILYSRNTDN